MARSFDGVNDTISFNAGVLSSFAFGTILVVMKRGASDWHGLVVMHTSGGVNTAGFEIGPTASVDDRLFWINDSTSRKSAFTITSADGWILTGAAKTTGTTTPRFHKYVYGSNTWTHSDADGTIANTTGTTDNVRVGDWQFTEYYEGDVAVVGIWKRALTDTEVEPLAHSLQAWYASAPDALWVLDQDSAGQTVVDQSGNGSTEAWHEGTTVATSSPLGPGYGHEVLVPHPAVVTSATINATAIACVATLPAPAVTTTNPHLVADRGSEQNLTGQTSTAVDMAAAGSIVVGNYLFARLALDNAGSSGAAVTLGVTDPRSNTWTIAGPANQDPAGANAGTTCYIAYCRVANAYTNGDDLTFTYNSVSVAAKAIVVEEWTNIHATVPLAVAATTATGASTTPSIARTPAAAGQLFYAALSVEGPIGDTYTQDSDTTDGPWQTLTSLATADGTAANNQCVRGVAKLVTGTTAQTWDPTITSRDWGQVALVFASVPQQAGATVNASAIACVASTPAPTVGAGSGVSPSAIAAVASLPAPSLATGSQVSPAVVAAVASLPAASVQTGSTVTVSVVAAVADLPAPAVSSGTNATVEPAVIASVVSLPVPTVGAGAGVSPAAVAATASVPAPSLSTGSVVSASVVAGVASLPAPTVGAGAGVSPAAIAAVASMPAPSLATGSVVTPAVIACAASLPAPGMSTGSTVMAATIAIGGGSARPASRGATNAGLKIDAGDLVAPTLPITGMTGSGTVRNIVSPGTYSGYDFPGAVIVQSDGVTIENCRWLASGDFWAVESYDHDTVIQDCEFETLVDRCITGSGFTARRLLFHDLGGDAFQIGDGGNALPTLIEDCAAYDWRPELDAHIDGVHLHENGVHDLTIRRCWFELVDAPGYTNPGGDTGYTSPVFCQPTTPGVGTQGTIRVESCHLESETGFFAIRFEDGVGSRCVAVDNLLDAVPNGGEQIDASAAFEGALNVLGDGSTEYHHPLETTPTDPLPSGGVQIPTPTVTTGSTATPAVIAAVASLPAASVQTGSVVSAVTIAATATTPAATVGSGAGANPATITSTASLPAPSLSTGSTVGAAVIAVSADTPAPVVQAGSGVTPATIAGAASIPDPALSTGSVVSPDLIACTASMPAPAVTAGGNATVSPSTIGCTASLPAPSLSTGSTVGASVVVCTVDLPAASLSTGVTVTASPISAAVSLPAPSLAAGQTVSAGVVSCTATLPAATVIAGTGITPSVIACTASLPAVAVRTGSTVSASVIAAVVAMPAPSVSVAGVPVPKLAGAASVAALGGSAETAGLSGSAASAGLGGTARTT